MINDFTTNGPYNISRYRLSLVNQADGFLVGGGLGMRIIAINSLSYQLIP